MTTTLTKLFTLLTAPSLNPTFVTSLDADNPHHYGKVYLAAGLKLAEKNTAPTLLELAYIDDTILEETLNVTSASIVNLFVSTPTSSEQSSQQKLTIQSILTVLFKHKFKYILCYYFDDDMLTLGFAGCSIEKPPLLIAIHEDLFQKILFPVTNFIMGNNISSSTASHTSTLTTEVSLDTTQLMRFALQKYQLLQLPLYNTLKNMRFSLDKKDISTLKENITFLEAKLAELAYFFRLATSCTYLKIDFLSKSAIWRNQLINKLIRGFLRCYDFFSPRLGQLYHYPGRPFSISNSQKIILARDTAPRISIVTPSFNQGNYIERTIQSVLTQNYPNLEYVIQDGLSTDNTVEVIQQYQNQLTHWQSIKDNGQSHAINLGFAHCHGEIMAYLNSDDLLLPGSLHYVANYFMQHPEVDVVYGHRVLIDENDLDIGRWVLPSHSNKILSWADYVPQETLFWRRRIWEKSGGKIDESFKFAMDWDLILRFREAGARFKRLPKFLGAFRVHAQQKTSTVVNEVGLQEMGRLRYRYLNYQPDHKILHRHIMPYLVRHFFYHKLYRAKILNYD